MCSPDSSHLLLKCYVISFLSFPAQLIGRAGRCGCQAIGHILTNAKELKTCSDDALSANCKQKENCRRRSLMESLGSHENFSYSGQCCDVCSTVAKCTEFNLLTPVSVRRKPRSRVVRSVGTALSEALMGRLLHERDTILTEDIGLKMLGKEVVLPTAAITDLCKRENICKARMISVLYQVYVALLLKGCTMLSWRYYSKHLTCVI